MPSSRWSNGPPAGNSSLIRHRPVDIAQTQTFLPPARSQTSHQRDLMKAARFYTAGDIRIDDVATPSIGSDDDVLVEVAFCGICGTDLHEYLAGPIVTPITAHPLTGATLPHT